MEEDGAFLLCGTESGDVIKFVLLEHEDRIQLVMVTCAVKRRRKGQQRQQYDVGVTADKFSGGIKIRNFYAVSLL